VISSYLDKTVLLYIVPGTRQAFLAKASSSKACEPLGYAGFIIIIISYFNNIPAFMKFDTHTHTVFSGLTSFSL